MNDERKFEITEAQHRLIIKSIDKSIEYAQLAAQAATTQCQIKKARTYRRMEAKYQQVKEILASLAD